MARTSQRLTPEMLAMLSSDELLTLQRINVRVGPEDDADHLLPPDGSE